MKKLLWYLIAGTRGGQTRAVILRRLIDRPYNANQLAESMNMDYKTIRHHLDVLVKNGIVTIEGDKYGAMYFISKAMEVNLDEFYQIWEKIDKPNVST
ncbi:MAG: winged helix-turn-helix domain-containing protein [Candidatus Methanoperedens sp.]|nr:winged helix-turn-helix domain-containing protein [Candidatus Methanoperedens sp.]MCZ7360219.1 winged helix-turn-helix domain-containing protein [Candidatus Methanoperedens sp.]HLB70146.1 winged helix-turn-helix domain-containing protein [Candidatus Methanoperedens sp.]